MVTLDAVLNCACLCLIFGWVRCMISGALLFPLASAMLYALAALFLNAAGKMGAGGRLTTAFCNGLLALFFLNFYDWSHFPNLGEPFWPVLLLGLLFVLGQMFTILALAIGEVSIVSPVMGLKVIMVNVLLAIGLREALPLRMWIAAVLSVVGVAALLAMVCLIPDGGGLRRLSLKTWKVLVPGGILLAAQSLLLIFAITRYQQVAQTNIVYSSRGIWSVVFVWLLGHLFANVELKHGSTLRGVYRLVGAILITLAIALAV